MYITMCLYITIILLWVLSIYTIVVSIITIQFSHMMGVKEIKNPMCQLFQLTKYTYFHNHSINIYTIFNYKLTKYIS